MGYYGDRRGDYYGGGRGDPGIFDFIKTAVKVVGGAAGGFLTGGPVGAIRGAVGGAVSAGRSNLRTEELAAGGSGSAYTPALRKAHSLALARGPAGSTTMMSSVARGGAHDGRMYTGRRRRMNWANGKALGRAERRIAAAVKHMSRYIKWVHPKKEGHAAPKFGGRKT